MSISPIEKKFIRKMAIIFVALALVLMGVTFLFNCRANGCWTDDWIMGWVIISLPVFQLIARGLENIIDFSHWGRSYFVLQLIAVVFSIMVESAFVGFLVGSLIVGVKRCMKKFSRHV